MKRYIKSTYDIEYRSGMYEVQDEMGLCIKDFLTKQEAEQFVAELEPKSEELYEYEFILPNEGDLSIFIEAPSKKDAWAELYSYKSKYNILGAYIYE